MPRIIREEPWGGLPVDGRVSLVYGAKTTQEAHGAAEIGRRLVLPDPASIRPFAADPRGAGAREIRRALDALERLGEGTPPAEFSSVCDSICAEFCAQALEASAVSHGSADGDWPPFYDRYFSVERLPVSSPPEAVIRSWVGALALVMRQTASTERGATHLSPVEFGLLWQSFATIIESIRELVEAAPRASV